MSMTICEKADLVVFVSAPSALEQAAGKTDCDVWMSRWEGAYRVSAMPPSTTVRLERVLRSLGHSGEYVESEWAFAEATATNQDNTVTIRGQLEHRNTLCFVIGDARQMTPDELTRLSMSAVKTLLG